MDQTEEAIKDKKNVEKHPSQFAMNDGIEQSLFGKRGLQTALAYLKTALPPSPDDGVNSMWST